MKVLMVEHFLPGSVYTLELCRALRTEDQITIFCRKGAPRPLEGVQRKGMGRGPDALRWRAAGIGR